MLAGVGLGKGYAWCAAYVRFVLDQCSIPTTIDAMALSTVPIHKHIWGKVAKVIKVPRQGDTFGIYYAQLKRIGHTGFITDWNGNKSICQTSEDNTSTGGSREGVGVFSRWRQKNQLHCVARWITFIKAKHYCQTVAYFIHLQHKPYSSC